MSMVATRHYLERGAPVEVLAQWKAAPGTCGARRPAATRVCRRCGEFAFQSLPAGRIYRCCAADTHAFHGAVRNVLIRRADGSTTVRPARGLTPSPMAKPGAAGMRVPAAPSSSPTRSTP